MRYRDAIKSPARCERENIGEDNAMGHGIASVERDGGEDVWPFVRETRRRIIRVEERQSILLKVVITGLLATLTAIVGGVVVVILTP